MEKDVIDESGMELGDVVKITYLESTASEDESYLELRTSEYERIISRNIFGIIERIDKNSIRIITEYTSMTAFPIMLKSGELDDFSDIDSTTIVRSSIINIIKYGDLNKFICSKDEGD